MSVICSSPPAYLPLHYITIKLRRRRQGILAFALPHSWSKINYLSPFFIANTVIRMPRFATFWVPMLLLLSLSYEVMASRRLWPNGHQWNGFKDGKGSKDDEDGNDGEYNNDLGLPTECPKECAQSPKCNGMKCICKECGNGFLKSAAECLAQSCPDKVDPSSLLNTLKSICDEFDIKIPKSAIKDASSAWESLTRSPTSTTLASQPASSSSIQTTSATTTDQGRGQPSLPTQTKTGGKSLETPTPAPTMSEPTTSVASSSTSTPTRSEATSTLPPSPTTTELPSFDPPTSTSTGWNSITPSSLEIIPLPPTKSETSVSTGQAPPAVTSTTEAPPTSTSGAAGYAETSRDRPPDMGSPFDTPVLYTNAAGRQPGCPIRGHLVPASGMVAAVVATLIGLNW